MTNTVINKTNYDLKKIIKSNMQEEMASILGVSQSLVSKLINGRPFGKKTALVWEKEFGINSVFLLTGQGDPVIRKTKFINEEGLSPSSPAPPLFRFILLGF